MYEFFFMYYELFCGFSSQLALSNAQTTEEVSQKAEQMKSNAEIFRKTAKEVRYSFCAQYYKTMFLLILVLGVCAILINNTWFMNKKTNYFF